MDSVLAYCLNFSQVFIEMLFRCVALIPCRWNFIDSILFFFFFIGDRLPLVEDMPGRFRKILLRYRRIEQRLHDGDLDEKVLALLNRRNLRIPDNVPVYLTEDPANAKRFKMIEDEENILNGGSRG